MKSGVFVFGCALLMTASAFAAGSSSQSAWVGVWRGEVNGQPTVTLTLADDSGELGGTVVFDMMEREAGGSAHVVIEPHVLLRPRLEGKTLTFRAMRLDHSLRPMDFSVVMDTHGNAQIHCLNCGPDAPTAELAKEQ